MTTDPCKDQLDYYNEAVEELEKAESMLRHIFPPVTQPLDMTRDVTPKIVDMEEWSNAKQERDEAQNKYYDAVEAYIECRNRFGVPK